MKKPLELTIHPPAVCTCELPTGCNWNCDEHGWIRSAVEDKRLSEPELAAEYWQAYSGWIDGHGKKARQRRETLERFATHPHYDEADR